MSFGEELAVCLSPLEDANVLEYAMSYVKLGDFPPVSTNDSLSDNTLQDPGVVSLRIHVVTQVPCCRLKMRLYIPLFWQRWLYQPFVMSAYLSYHQTNTRLALPHHLSDNGRSCEWPGHEDGSPEGSLELQVVHYLFTQVMSITAN